VQARWILAVLAAVFLAAAARGWWGRGGNRGGARTWLIVGAVFAIVSAWLWSGG